MEKSTNYKFNLPNSANDEIADINDISDNFRIIDEKLKIDQTFSETSEKPQSGKAIAEEIGKKQDYFADVFSETVSDDRVLSLRDGAGNTSGQITIKKNGGVRYTDVVTPQNDTDGANKKYVDDESKNVKSYASDNFANALKGNAIGQAVRLSDVSPNEHTLGVKVSSKNAIRYPYTFVSKTINGVTYTANSDGSITVSGTATARSQLSENALVPLQQGKQYTFSGYLSGRGATSTLTDTTYTENMVLRKPNDAVTFTAGKEKYFWVIVVREGITANATLRPQLELGTTVTAYTPFVKDLSSVTVTRYGTVETDSPQTYIPTADGTISGVKSLYPTTTLMTDTEGTIIEAEYNRDINKAFAELQQAIISIGGNV